MRSLSSLFLRSKKGRGTALAVEGPIKFFTLTILPKSPSGEFREGDRVSGGGSNKILYLDYPP